MYTHLKIRTLAYYKERKGPTFNLEEVSNLGWVTIVTKTEGYTQDEQNSFQLLLS
jgi:hypothetical protein